MDIICDNKLYKVTFLCESGKMVIEDLIECRVLNDREDNMTRLKVLALFDEYNQIVLIKHRELTKIK